MKTYPMQAYKIMHGLWGMGQMIPRLRDQIPRDGRVDPVCAGSRVH